MVVGYDGSPPARHALDQAVDLLRYREGALEVVFVAHLPVGATLSAAALAEVRQGLDEQARALAEEVRDRLAGQDHSWHFQRRDGAVAAELKAVAADVHRRYGETVEIVIVVGRLGSPVSPCRRIGRLGCGPRRYFPGPGRALRSQIPDTPPQFEIPRRKEGS